MSTQFKVEEIAKELREMEPGLSVFESFTLACEVYKIKMFEVAFMLPGDLRDFTAPPSALEAISMALGFEPKKNKYPLEYMADALDEINIAIREKGE